MPKAPNQLKHPAQTGRIGVLTWLELLVTAGIVLVAAAAVYTTFLSAKTENGDGSVFSQLMKRANALGSESDPIRRDAMCIPLSSFCRSLDAQIPTNSSVFLLNMLGPENGGNLGYYYFINNYLYPREVGISLGKSLTFGINGYSGGRNPASAEELAQAGYDFVLGQSAASGWQIKALKPIAPRPAETNSLLTSGTDTLISFLLPLAVALAGTRMIKWLFGDLRGLLSIGEWLACGLAVGIYLLMQLILLLRIMGFRLEQFLGIAVIVWALVEIGLLLRNWKPLRLEFSAKYFWWLLLIPVGIMFWCLFRLAGLDGMQEFDAVATWEFKSKLLYYTAGKGIWSWASNPAFAYTVPNYPLTVSLLYAFQWGLLGHINEFVIKFWNQWMLLLLVFAALGAGRFSGKKPWLMAAVSTIITLLPATLMFTRWEGSTIPFLFYIALASIQLALGMAEKEPRRLRLGLFILMGSAMVRIDGGIIFGVWGILLFLVREDRIVVWPLHRIGIAGLVGLLAWLPYFFYRAHTIGHPNDLAPHLVMQNWMASIKTAPMTWVALVSRRLFNNDFATWISLDGHHALWGGKWMGLESFVDNATLGLGWVSLLVFVLFCMKGSRIRRVAFSFFVVCFIYSIVICITILGGAMGQDSPTSNFYTKALAGSEMILGGRYLYPPLMAWFVASAILFSRRNPLPPNSSKLGNIQTKKHP